MRRLFLRHALCATILVLVAAVGAVASPLTEPPATQGATCSFGPYHFGAIGNVLPSVAESDRRGPRGNEVNAISRVFYALRNGHQPPAVGFAGWLTSSFDGRYAFTPIGSAVSVAVVAPSSLDRLPLPTLLKPIARAGGIDSSIRPLVSAKSSAVSTAVAPCFATQWDGH